MKGHQDRNLRQELKQRSQRNAVYWLPSLLLIYLIITYTGVTFPLVGWALTWQSLIKKMPPQTWLQANGGIFLSWESYLLDDPMLFCWQNKTTLHSTHVGCSFLVFLMSTTFFASVAFPSSGLTRKASFPVYLAHIPEFTVVYLWFFWLTRHGLHALIFCPVGVREGWWTWTSGRQWIFPLCSAHTINTQLDLPNDTSSCYQGNRLRAPLQGR